MMKVKSTFDLISYILGPSEIYWKQIEVNEVGLMELRGTGVLQEEWIPKVVEFKDQEGKVKRSMEWVHHLWFYGIPVRVSDLVEGFSLEERR